MAYLLEGVRLNQRSVLDLHFPMDDDLKERRSKLSLTVAADLELM